MKSALILIVAAFSFSCSRPAITEGNTLTNFSATEESQAETDLALEREFAEIAIEAKGKVGVAAVEIETGRSAYFNHNERFAMQSVVKLPISMAVLKLVEEEKYRIDEAVYVSKSDMVSPMQRSPIRDGNPNGVQANIEGLIRSAIIESDGTASDVLQRVAGDAKGVQAYIDSLGIVEMEVKHTHKEFAKEWELQYENWASPEGAVALLTSLWEMRGESGSVPPAAAGGLTSTSRTSEEPTASLHAKLLLQFMTDSIPGRNRLKGLLPEGTPIAHKTGTGGTRTASTVQPTTSASSRCRTATMSRSLSSSATHRRMKKPAKA